MTDKNLPVPWAALPDMTPELEDFIREILAAKWVQLNAEYGTDGVFCFFCEVRATYLPISESLVQRLYAWNRLLEELSTDHYDEDNPPDVKRLADMGYEIAFAMKRELPDWTVSYADDLYYYLSPSGEYCPAVLPDGSLGETVLLLICTES